MTGPTSPLPTVAGFVFEDRPGLKDLYLPAVPGLTVLYGLNGAGKTRVLQGIADAYQGVRGGAQLLIKVPEPQVQPVDWEPAFEDDEWSAPLHLQGEIKAELCHAWSPESLSADHLPRLDDYYVDDATFESIYRSVVWDLLSPEVEAYVDPFLGALDPGRVKAMRVEMLTQRLVLITPTGSVDFPSWTVSPAAIEDDDHPAVSAELRRTSRVRSWQDAGENADEVLHSDYGEPLDGEGFVLVGRTAPVIGAARGIYHSQISSFTMPRLDLEPVEFESADPEGLVRANLLGYEPVAPRLFNALGSDVPRRPLDIHAATVAAGQASSGPSLLAVIEDRANNLYAGALLDAPELKLTVLPLKQWWAGQPIRWSFGPADLSLDVMSSAESRWARWAISHAVRESDPETSRDAGGTLTLVDEPERALHRSAEAHMAEQLHTFASQDGRQVIVSTHSPELLNLPDVRLLEVRRGTDDLSSVSPFTAENRDELAALGLLPSDLLRRQRGFVMVEGEHDEKLLEHWIGPQLKSMRLTILNLRGAKNLPSTIESQVLFNFTDAHLFVVLDNLRTSELEDAWKRAVRLKKTHSDAEALEHLLGSISARSGEGKWIREWLSRALTENREERLTPFSIEVPDIIDLVEVGHLVPRATSWSDLRAEYEARPPGRQEHFKAWLTRTKGARFETERIVAAAPSEPPEIVKEFVRKAASVLAA